MSRGPQFDYSIWYATGTHMFTHDVTPEETYTWFINKGVKKVPAPGTLKHFLDVKKLLLRPDLLNALIGHARNNSPVFAQVAADYKKLYVNIKDELDKKHEAAVNSKSIFEDDNKEKEMLQRNLEVAISQNKIKDKRISELEAKVHDYELILEKIHNLLNFN